MLPLKPRLRYMDLNESLQHKLSHSLFVSSLFQRVHSVPKVLQNRFFQPGFGPSRRVIVHHRSIDYCHLKVKFKALIAKDKEKIEWIANLA